MPTHANHQQYANSVALKFHVLATFWEVICQSHCPFLLQELIYVYPCVNVPHDGSMKLVWLPAFYHRNQPSMKVNVPVSRMICIQYVVQNHQKNGTATYPSAGRFNSRSIDASKIEYTDLVNVLFSVLGFNNKFQRYNPPEFQLKPPNFLLK